MEKRAENGRGGIKRVVCGGIVGAASGLFGGGGGMIAVPLLRSAGLEEKRAHATAILLILPVAALAFLLYAWNGQYQSGVLLPTAIGVTVGGLLGAKLLDILPVRVVRIVFSILQLLAGLSMLFF